MAQLPFYSVTLTIVLLVHMPLSQGHVSTSAHGGTCQGLLAVLWGVQSLCSLVHPSRWSNHRFNDGVDFASSFPVTPFSLSVPSSYFVLSNPPFSETDSAFNSSMTSEMDSGRWICLFYYLTVIFLMWLCLYSSVLCEGNFLWSSAWCLWYLDILWIYTDLIILVKGLGFLGILFSFVCVCKHHILTSESATNPYLS